MPGAYKDDNDDIADNYDNDVDDDHEGAWLPTHLYQVLVLKVLKSRSSDCNTFRIWQP